MSGDVGQTFDQMLQQAPLIAILRGLPSEDAIKVCQALFDAGVRLAEVPLNSPAPLATIALLSTHFEGRMLIGAGTVLTSDQAQALAGIGCAFCVSPNTDPAVIAAALALEMVPVPGFSSPSEAFVAISAGARHLKAFPAHGVGPRLSALSAVLPRDVSLIAVGEVSPEDVPALREAGVSAVGIGSDLYKPGRPAAEVGIRATTWMHALQRPAPARVALVCNPQTLVGESPIINGSDVLWVDPTGPSLLRWNGQACTRVPLSEPVWSLGLANGQLVGNGEERLVAIDGDGALTPGPDIDVGAGCRLNDLVIDAHGGLWAGSMHRALLSGRGALFYAAAPTARPKKVAEGLGVANGMAFSADGRTLFVIDTLSRTLLAYPADIEAGTLEEPRVITDFLGIPGKPDGMAMSPDGRLWVAMWGGYAVLELAPNGAVLRSVPVPAPHVGSLCFAADGRLFITTARARLTDHALAQWAGSGGLFVVEP